MTRESYEQRKIQLDEKTNHALQEFEKAKNALGNVHKACLDLDAEWSLTQARANATPGMWPKGLNDPVMVAAAKVLTDAGHAPALIGGDDVRYCKDTGFFIPTRRTRDEDEEVEVWHLVDGSDRQKNCVDGWYEQLDAYRNAFRDARWRIEWHADVRSLHVAPAADRTTEQ